MLVWGKEECLKTFESLNGKTIRSWDRQAASSRMFGSREEQLLAAHWRRGGWKLTFSNSNEHYQVQLCRFCEPGTVYKRHLFLLTYLLMTIPKQTGEIIQKGSIIPCSPSSSWGRQWNKKKCVSVGGVWWWKGEDQDQLVGWLEHGVSASWNRATCRFVVVVVACGQPVMRYNQIAGGPRTPSGDQQYRFIALVRLMSARGRSPTSQNEFR